MNEEIEMRDGFIIHEKTLKQMARLNPEDTKYLMTCLAEYYTTSSIDIDKVAETSIAVAVILDDAIERMDADSEAYAKSVEQRRQAANKRWNKDADGMRDDATACGRIPPQCESDAGNAVSVSDSVSESVLKENSPSESKRKCFRIPTVEEVREYCAERQNSVDPQQFVDFYSSKGWRVGNQPMKDWKACVRTWEKRERGNAPPPKVTKFDQGMVQNYDNRELARMIVNGV